MQEKFGKLQRMTVRGYKSIKEIDGLELRDINIIVGQNGAGKSNLVSLFRFMGHLVNGELQQFVTKQGGLQKLLHFGPKSTKELGFIFESEYRSYDAALQPTNDGRLMFSREIFDWLGDSKSITSSNQFETRLWQQEWLVEGLALVSLIEGWRIYHFHDTSQSSTIRDSSHLIVPEKLDSNGGNIAAFLYFMQEKHPVILSTVIHNVRQVAPFIGSFVLRPDALNENLIRLRWRHVGRDEIFDVSDLSDGTLRFIALTALLLQPDPPSTIVIDEPELGLHPAAIAQLAALMKQVAPRVQIIAATQSPTFANHFGWEDFVVVDRVEEASRFRRLTLEEVEPWYDELPMGEIWEKNLIGGRP